jgi:hypothetical protein
VGKDDVEAEDSSGDTDSNAKEKKEQSDENNTWIKGLRKISKCIRKKYRFPGPDLKS